MRQFIIVHTHLKLVLQCKAALVSQIRIAHKMIASTNDFDLSVEFVNKNDEKAILLFLLGSQVENYNFRYEEALLKLNKDVPG